MVLPASLESSHRMPEITKPPQGGHARDNYPSQNMATLIPSHRSCASRMTSGENRLAQRLESKLDDDYLLWYDVPVGPKCLHPDFILLHPSRGLFVLEVKDWKLETIRSVTPESFEIVTSPQGALKQVKHPLSQARDYALAICSLLEKDPALVQTTGRYQGKLLCPYAYGVVLPNITRAQFDSAPALERVIESHLVICQDEMFPSVDSGDFQERLWAMSHYNFGITLESEQIDRIRWHLYPEMRISSKQLSFFDEPPIDILQSAIPQVLRVMDLQQEQLARSLGEGHRVIHGVAGSGKTLILAYRCQHLAQAEQSVLVLCFNVALASKLRSLITAKDLNPLVTVRHFHGWCTDILRRYQLPRPDSRKYRGLDYIRQLEHCVIAAVEAGNIPKGQYAAVMVDEGHDFAPEWLKLVAQMVNPSTDSLLVLYDDAQNLYGKRAKRQFSFKELGIKAQGRTTILKLNYRNTAQVLMLAYEFAKEIMEPTDAGDEDVPPMVEPNSAGREGPVPVLMKCANYKAEIAYIINRAQQLQARGTPWHEMAIIYRTNWMGEAAFTQLQRAGVPVAWLNQNSSSRNFDPLSPSIKLMTMHTSKGLEFPVVFIPGLGHLPNPHGEVADEAQLLYVAMTRAIEMLVLTGDRRSAFVERLKGALGKVG
ncbi:MAG: Nuclease-related domain/Part of AAA domain/UvrD-like helicase C-terminal domain [Phormidesmis priestleyi Ana]|uniref:Nuclease-related domain/Part of AAA domain/UvrD-like helicase C-terminal domain n=1 Tax=Phormidesmis priestleyi Ana TaxID=1666911 RepID=A0A0P8BDT1_9CYAN|nr:MAG: Nuclease-related domain/Part of AAA domain/UvrD-like helicase C-terminal domain [Phormidesmis priestleyi Ana]